jgi:integrase
LSLATRRQRENIFKQILKTAADEPVTRITKTAIIAGRDRRAQTPSQARHFLQAMRGLFCWALDADHVKVDPTHGVEDPPRPKSGGFPIWTEDDVAAYERRWPVGTRQRVWLDVLLYTGLRRGDAVRLGRQHVKDGIATTAAPGPSMAGCRSNSRPEQWRLTVSVTRRNTARRSRSPERDLGPRLWRMRAAQRSDHRPSRNVSGTAVRDREPLICRLFPKSWKGFSENRRMNAYSVAPRARRCSQ